jgi:glycosyltransferase 2 family protein
LEVVDNLVSSIRVILISFLFSFVAIALLILTGERFDLEAFIKALRLNPIGLMLLVPTLCIWWGLMGLRVKLLASQLPGGQRINLWRATQASILSLFSAAVTPAASGSSFGLAWYLSRFIDSKQATAIAVYGLVLDLVFYAWSLPLSFAILQWRKIDLGIPFLGALSIAGALIMIVFAWGLANGAQTLSRIIWNVLSFGFLKRFRRSAFVFLQRTEQEIAGLRKMSITNQVTLHIVNGLGWFFHFAAFNVVAFGLGIQNFDHVGIMAAQSLVVSSSFIVPTPGGSGYFEFALGKVFAAIGVSSEARTPLVLIWRFLSYYLYILIGPFIGGLALLNVSAKKTPQ